MNASGLRWDRSAVSAILGASDAQGAAAERAGAPGIAEVYKRYIAQALVDFASAEIVSRNTS